MWFRKKKKNLEKSREDETASSTKQQNEEDIDSDQEKLNVREVFYQHDKLTINFYIKLIGTKKTTRKTIKWLL